MFHLVSHCSHSGHQAQVLQPRRMQAAGQLLDVSRDAAGPLREHGSICLMGGVRVIQTALQGIQLEGEDRQLLADPVMQFTGNSRPLGLLSLKKSATQPCQLLFRHPARLPRTHREPDADQQGQEGHTESEDRMRHGR